MTLYNVQPWPSTYKAIEEEVKPRKLIPNAKGREVGAFRSAIPPHTIEPPQIHLIAQRDGKPFQELLTDLDDSLFVMYFDPKTGEYRAKKYLPGQDIVIPEYTIHWLVNLHDKDLGFTCEYAPHPWDGENDEPEFPDLTTLLQFINKEGLMEKLRSPKDLFISEGSKITFSHKSY